jgi:hypothetical protein
MPYTIPSALSWPDALKLRERSVEWILDFGLDASPPALDGTRQLGSSNGGGLWRLNMTGVQLRRPEHVKAWLTFELALRGGATPVDVPLFLTGYQPTYNGQHSGVVIRATNGGWPARAVSGRVELIHVDSLEPPHHFADYDSSIYGWRMHRIETVTLSSGDLADITFWPPARFAVANNHQLEFDAPKQVMRLSGSGSTDLDLEYRKRGNPNAEFVEAGG